MKIVKKRMHNEVTEALTSGQLVVLRTDTIYGIVARAEDEIAVRRLHAVRHRPEDKAFIVLAASIEMAQTIVDPLTPAITTHLNEWWPGKVSIILPAHTTPYAWLKNPDHTIAVRVPADEELCELLRQTGPLVAPSANLPDELPAHTIHEAIGYFGDDVAVYVDSGAITDNTPSMLWRAQADGSMERLR